MGLPLDDILKIEGLCDLGGIKGEIQETLIALLLQEGRSYLSVGIGRNRLPLIIALHGLYVTGIDKDPEKLEYQRGLSGRFAPYIQNAGGSLEVERVDIDRDDDHFCRRFDYVECVNFKLRGEPETEVAQILMNLGNSNPTYLVSTFGGPTGTEDKIVQALTGELRRLQRTVEIVDTGLLTSDRYRFENGVILRVY